VRAVSSDGGSLRTRVPDTYYGQVTNLPPRGRGGRGRSRDRLKLDERRDFALTTAAESFSPMGEIPREGDFCRPGGIQQTSLKNSGGSLRPRVPDTYYGQVTNLPPRGRGGRGRSRDRLKLDERRDFALTAAAETSSPTGEIPREGDFCRPGGIQQTSLKNSGGSLRTRVPDTYYGQVENLPPRGRERTEPGSAEARSRTSATAASRAAAHPPIRCRACRRAIRSSAQWPGGSLPDPRGA